EIEGIGTAPRFRAVDAAGRILAERRWDDGAARAHESFLAELIGWIETQRGRGRIVAAGHRVVHGGTSFTTPVLIDDGVLAELDRLIPLAPLHQPHNLAAIRTVARIRPDLPQVACFDTAFHRTAAPVAMRFALPREFEASGVRRYGFHGLSYEYIAGALTEIAPQIARVRVIVAHLGNGASLCAMHAGKSVDTTMGFTALDGLPMGTRCGALDPGVVLYLLQERGFDAARLEDLLYRRSGLLGVSGIGSDMRALLGSSDPRAAEAVDLFVFRIVREIGALAASLGGLDGIVFTAGIGEHAAPIRKRVCEGAAWLGIQLDPAANAAGATCITRRDSRVSAWVIPTDEDLMIARHTRRVVCDRARDACR
ncbi:MAG TPA: acetate/propionate family kinase, partial [Stellaceae bacterium]|nr:acetate/propionate family kinase [Stellaceae bacterium]